MSPPNEHDSCQASKAKLQQISVSKKVATHTLEHTYHWKKKVVAATIFRKSSSSAWNPVSRKNRNLPLSENPLPLLIEAITQQSPIDVPGGFWRENTLQETGGLILAKAFG